MCSQVVRLLSIKNMWKASKQATMMKNIAITRRPRTRQTLGSKTEMPWTPSRKKAASSMACSRRNHRNSTRLFSPTQLPIQGQWWSCVRTHRPQSWQCFVRSGWYTWQRLHQRSSTPACVGGPVMPSAPASSPAAPPAPRRFWRRSPSVGAVCDPTTCGAAGCTRPCSASPSRSSAAAESSTVRCGEADSSAKVVRTPAARAASQSASSTGAAQQRRRQACGAPPVGRRYPGSVSDVRR
mmetsp:Transcript_125144/g.354194  ORF Transcript_125144/g.354194 Transcript_125144/m.354194 type:complete len:239 (-) Transcript_125144:328-1044(-)